MAYRAVARSGASHRHAMLVVGCGTIGLMVIAVARAAGVRRIGAVAAYETQAAMARKMGAEPVAAPKDGSTAGEADVVVETTGSEDGLHRALEVIRPGGRVVLMGGYHGMVKADVGRVVGAEAWVTGSNCYARTGMRRDFEWAIDMIRDRQLPVVDLVSHRFPLREIQQAFAVAADKTSGSIKVHVTMA